MRISWIDIPERVEHELRQVQEEGEDVTELVRRSEHEKRQNLPESEFRNKGEEFYREIEASWPAAREFPDEPSAWNTATQLCRFETGEVPSYSREFVENRILGGWLGRAAGCLLGKPVEGIPRQAVKEILVSNGTWPIRD